jgi:hypothetical protein
MKVAYAGLIGPPLSRAGAHVPREHRDLSHDLLRERRAAAPATMPLMRFVTSNEFSTCA